MQIILLKLLQYVQAYSIKLVWIIILLLLGKLLLRRIVNKILYVITTQATKNKGNQQRAKTLSSIFVTAGNIVIYTIVLLMILDVFGVDIRPILAGAGIIGLAVGFGSKTMVQDLISGLFIIMENQYAIGEKVMIGKHTGEVIKLNIRSTVLKNEDNQIVFMSNSTIKDVINLSR